MASNKTKLSVGIFVLGGILLILMTIIWMGVNKSIDEAKRYVIFFDESIQGLDIGSQVKYRGVPVGRVESLSIAPDSRLIQATIEIRPEHDIAEQSVAQLRSVGITGAVYIGLDVITLDRLSKRPEINFPVKYPVIVSIPSSKSELLQSIENVAKKVESTDTVGISLRMITTLDKINAALDDLNIKDKSTDMDRILVSADQNLSELNQLIKGLTEMVDNNKNEVDRSLDKFEVAINNANELMRSGKIFVENAQVLIGKSGGVLDSGNDSIENMEASLNSTLRNLDAVIKNMSELVNRLEQQPSLLLAAPPEPRKIQ